MSNENAQRFGALGGALGGAALGGIIGHQNGRGGEGALIGGLGGAAYGYQNGPKHLGGDGSIQQTRRTN